MANSDSKKYFVKDEALHGIDNDQFHYADLSKVLSEIIDTNAPPFNVAIIGKWGLGKSSLINLVTDRCKKQPKKYCVQEINAWKYEKESLRRVFLKQLWQGLNDNKKFHSFQVIKREILDVVKGELQESSNSSNKCRLEFVKIPAIVAAVSMENQDDISATILGLYKAENYLCCTCEGSRRKYCKCKPEKEAEERRQKEQRQKAAHAAACAKIEEQIKAEAAPMVTSITDEYEVKLRNAQREMKKAISEADKQRDSIQGSISDLRSQKSSLGFFKFKEKKVLQAQIDELEKTLNAISTQQQIYYEYQLLFDRIEKEKKQATDKVMAQIRPKYPMPKYEDFIEK